MPQTSPRTEEVRISAIFLFACVLSLMSAVSLADATGRMVRVCVRDQNGRAITDAQLQLESSPPRSIASDTAGCATFSASGKLRLRVTRAGFASVSQEVGDGAEQTIVLSVAGTEQKVEVTARTPLALDASASSLRTMTEKQMMEAPGFTLDDRLRQVAGFQLFRRTSSWVANPTSQGTSLRGLGSTAASRTLVLSDQVPLNDAYGGWIHWNEIPALAVREVEIMRGGASDLYGSSAIGGVIDVVPVTPKRFGYALDLSGANEGTSNLNGLLTGGRHRWSALGAATLFRTNGYILTAPEVRGPVDVAANVHSQSGRVELRRSWGTDDGVFLRGNLLNEARGNGTPLQTNGTRIWRYVAGGDWDAGGAGRFLLRFHGMEQKYRQSFSAINAARTVEKLTALHLDPSQQVGGVAQWARSYGNLTLVAGGDVLDSRGTDLEMRSEVSTSARQRDEGAYGEALWQPESWSFAFSSRFDHFGSFDAKQVGGVPPVLPDISENIFDLRIGVVKKMAGWLSLTASGFRAFRAPTMNELYRQFQVGQQITLANPRLKSERATGFEGGTLLNGGRSGSVRLGYFWTQVNRPVASITLKSTPASTLLQRRNLGQLTSKGFTAEWELRPAGFLMLTGGYQYANSTVTKFQADPTLVGKWTPQVPRNSASLQVRLERDRLGVLSVDLRTSGRQFDDSANQFRLGGYAQVDLYAERAFGNRFRVYGSVQNLLNQPMQAGRTPLLTLGAPRMVLVGVRLHH